MFIEADLHCHSLASTHAYSTLKEMAESAVENGLKLFALTDHAPEMTDSPHIWHFHNLEILPRYIRGVPVLRGVEANIKNKYGELDMSIEDLDLMEWVVASCHAPVIAPGSVEENTNAYINLMKRYEQVDVIGHPTAQRFPVDFDKLAAACKEYGKFPELNESSAVSGRSSEENCIALLDACKRHSVPIVVNTDCHYCDIIGCVPTAQKLIEKAGFPEELIFNRDWKNVTEYIAKKRNITIERED